MGMPAVQLDTWTTERARTMLVRRLKDSKGEKEALGLPEQWAKNYQIAYTSIPDVEGQTVQGDATSAGGNSNPVRASVGVNTTLKNLRLLHSQLSANPPSCIPRPATSDQEDRRAARAADRVIRHALRAYVLQERTDQVTLHTLLDGIGILKHWWDPTRGDILKVGKDGKSLVLEGDMNFRVVDPKKWHPDPRAKSDDAVNFIIEEVEMSREDFLVRFPEHRGKLARAAATQQFGQAESFDPSATLNSSVSGDSGADEVETITVFEYWETGLPSNGYAGRFAVFLADGTLLVPPMNSPHAFRPRPTLSDLKARRAGKKIRSKPPKARLPYSWLTDIDVPQCVWGKSFIEFAGPLQDLSNRLLSTTLANLQAHAVARLLVEDGCEVTNSSWTNDPYVVVKVKRKPGSAEPKFMDPMTLPAALPELQNRVDTGVGDMAGTNESMFGVQSRETSGYSMQYAVNQGNLIRRRLFNKYVKFVESVYQTILDLAIKHWTAARTIEVLGKEKSFELMDLRGADIVGGYSLVVEYGTSLSLDPMTRRDEILRLREVLKSAGVSDRTILSMLRLGELDSLTDATDLASDRMREVVERIVATDTQVNPEEFEDHDGMLAYALVYVMTKEFQDLEFDHQALVREHMRLRFAQSKADKATMAGDPNAVDPAAGGIAADGAAPIGGGAPIPPAQPVPEAVPPGAISSGPAAA